MKFTKGQLVKVRAVHIHRCEGMTGIVTDPQTLIGTVSVEIDGQSYGFFPLELIPVDSPE